MITLTELLRQVIQENTVSPEKIILWHGTSETSLEESEPGYVGIYTTRDIRVSLDYAQQGDKSVYMITLKPSAKLHNLSDPEEFYDWCKESGVLESLAYEVPESEIENYDPECVIKKLPTPDSEYDAEEQMYMVVDSDVLEYLKNGTIYNYDSTMQNDIASYSRNQGYDVLIIPDYLGDHHSGTEHISYVILNLNCIDKFKKYNAEDIERIGINQFLNKYSPNSKRF